MEGILSVDKPLNLTSHDVVSRVRRLADTRRVGHAGTLDPLATGVLVLALGRATRLLEYIVERPKEYFARVRMGQVSTTYDSEGAIVETGKVPEDRSVVSDLLDGFRGSIEQVPPMHSALKKEGVPLYKLARKGIEVEREAREVTVYELELLVWEPPVVELRIVCSAGTYIRSLAHDLGQSLGCGAYLAGLRRTAVGPFVVENAVALDTLNPENIARYVQSMDSALDHVPTLHLSPMQAESLAQGRRLARAEEHPQAGLARAYDAAGTFVGIVIAKGDFWQPRKIFYHPVSE